MLELNKVPNEELKPKIKSKKNKISQQIVDLKVGENLSIDMSKITFKQKDAIRNRVYNIRMDYGRNIKASVIEIDGVDHYVIMREKDDRRKTKTPRGKHSESIGNKYPISDLETGEEIKIDITHLTHKSKDVLKSKASYVSKKESKDIRTTHKIEDGVKYFVIYRSM